jgi:hypothetical protein
LKLPHDKLRQLSAKSTATKLFVFLIPLQRARRHRVDVVVNIGDHLQRSNAMDRGRHGDLCCSTTADFRRGSVVMQPDNRSAGTFAGFG